jgi:uncharacterized membrane protein YhhN
MFFLGLAILSASPSSYLIYIGAFLGMVGDVFLIFKNKIKLVLMGLGFFLIGHICYIAQIIIFLASKGVFEWWSYCYMLLFFVLLVAITVLPIRDFTKGSKDLTISGSLYASTLISVFAASIMGVILGYSRFFAITAIGAFFFIMSDAILSFTMFRRDIKRRDFYIMVTYLLGESFICMSLLLTVI